MLQDDPPDWIEPWGSWEKAPPNLAENGGNAQPWNHRNLPGFGDKGGHKKISHQMTRVGKKNYIYIYNQVQATGFFVGGDTKFCLGFFRDFKKKSLVSFVQFGSWMKIGNVFSLCQVSRRLKRKTNHWNPILPVKGQREILGVIDS